jgi:Ca2+-binding RTX toxin-like protein
LTGSAAANVLDGAKGNDAIDGGGGADTLRGGEGDDQIEAQDGVKDIVECGLGTDRDCSCSHAVDGMPLPIALP